jgi:hypothetical protein
VNRSAEPKSHAFGPVPSARIDSPPLNTGSIRPALV